MISFTLSDEQDLVRSFAARLASERLRPLSRALSSRRGARDARDIDDALLTEISALGLVQGIAASGGTSARLLSVLALEEIAFGDANAAIAIAAPAAFVRAIAEQGSAGQIRDFLPLFGDASYRAAAIAAAEPGLDVRSLDSIQTSLQSSGDGFILDGRKVLVPFAERCSHFLVIAREGNDLRAVIVSQNAGGVAVEAPRLMMGCTSSAWCDVVFDKVSVSSDMMLGGTAGCDVQRLVNDSWIAGAAILAGIARAAHECAIAYAKERKIGGQPLATKQSVAMALVDMFTESESLRWMTWRAAAQVDRKLDATRFARLSNIRACDVATSISDESLQIMSGHGYMSENLMESWYRNAHTVAALDVAFGV